MPSLRMIILSVTLLPTLWAEPGASSSISLDKRFSINMMDPLTRRSALDKNFVRFGRSNGGVGINRESRGRSDSFVRFGRGDDEEDDIEEMLPLKSTRGRTDFIRFGRGGSNSGFIRFGRDNSDDFLRLGRARQDNFIRFGKSDILYQDPTKDDYGLHRFVRGNNGPKGHNTNFVRFGKRDPENDEEIVNAYKNGLNFDLDEFRKQNLARNARLPNRNKGDSFIRFGREPSFGGSSRTFGTSLKETKYYPSLQPTNSEYNDDTQTSDSDPELDPSKSTSTNTESSSYSNYDHEISRQKRSASLNDDNRSSSSTVTPDLSPFYNYPSPLVAGLPNFIIGPELSMLPKQSKLNSGKKHDDKNFIRLG